MANVSSSKKRARHALRRAQVNRARLSRVRTFVRKVEQAIAAGDKAKAQAAFRIAEPELARGVKTGVVHRNTMARRLSRLSARIKAMSG